MAIAYPRPEPAALQVAALSFRPQPNAGIVPVFAGEQIAVTRGPTLWRARYDVALMKQPDYGVVRAWHATLLSVRGFLGYDRLRAWPLLYPQGFAGLTVEGEPFTGAATLAGVSGADAGLVTLADLPAAFALRDGDYIAFRYGSGSSRRALHMVVAGGDADAGGAITIEVAPRVRVGWSAGATVELERPTALMKIIPDTWDESVDYRLIGRVSFEAIQSLERV